MSHKAITVGWVDRRYGGPEEGGWYYNHFEPQDVIWRSGHAYEKALAQLRADAEAHNAKLPPLSSVTQPTHMRVVEGLAERTIRPHYE